MTLYQHLPLPAKYESKFISIHTDEQFIGISEDQTRYMPLTETDLTNCRELDKLWYCTNTNSFYRKSHMSCIYALYTTDEHYIGKMCHFQIYTPQNIILQLDTLHFLTYAHSEQTATLNCHSLQPADQTITFTGFRLFKVFAGCFLKTDEFIAEGSTSIYSSSKELHLEKVELIKSNDFTKVMAQLFNSSVLDTIHPQSKLRLRDIAKEIADHETSWHFTIGNLSILSILTLLAIIIGTYVFCAPCRNCTKSCCTAMCKREQKQDQDEELREEPRTKSRRVPKRRAPAPPVDQEPPRSRLPNLRRQIDSLYASVLHPQRGPEAISMEEVPSPAVSFRDRRDNPMLRSQRFKEEL